MIERDQLCLFTDEEMGIRKRNRNWTIFLLASGVLFIAGVYFFL